MLGTTCKKLALHYLQKTCVYSKFWRFEYGLMMRKQITLLLLLGWTLLISGTVHASEKLEVVTSWSILEDVVSHIGGAEVQVSSVAPRGVELHEIRLSPKDQIRLRKADLVISLGLKLETWLDPSLKRIEADKHLELGPSLTNLVQLGTNTGSAALSDPHIWHDVKMMVQVAQLVEKRLSQQMPEHSETFASNLKKYNEELMQLDAWVQQELKFIAKENRHFVTDHQAFEYFGRAYGFKTMAPRGLNSHDQPSPRFLQKMIQRLKKQNVRVLFMEQGGNATLLKRISEEAGMRLQDELMVENLAPVGKTGDTYQGFIRYNIETISTAFKAVTKL